jgi:hypothetical protein
MAWSKHGRQRLLACFLLQAEKDRIALAWDDDQDWSKIDDIRLRYFNGRVNEVRSIKLDEPDLIDGTVELLRGACAQLSAALEHENHSPWFWEALSVGAPELTRESLGVLAQTLDHRADMLNRYPHKKIRIGEAGSKLIVQLAEMFRDKGLTPAAPNPTGTMAQKTAERIRRLGVNPAEADLLPPFPALVREVITSLPQELWPEAFWATKHARSSGAFLKAINRTLRPSVRTIRCARGIAFVL